MEELNGTFEGFSEPDNLRIWWQCSHQNS